LDRNRILQVLEKGLKSIKEINAMWLEGSDGTGKTDEYSDLDIVLDVNDGFEREAFQHIEALLSRLAPLDLCYERENYHPQLSDKVYHLKGTPETLLLDVAIQSHSRNFNFIKENDSEIPSVIFDKTGVIQFENLNQQEFQSELRERLYHLENTIRQKSRVEKYIKRGKIVEAMGYYNKFVLAPLIELLRIKYKPVNHDYYIVSFSKHLPHDVVKEVEQLFFISSLEDLSEKLAKVYDWFFAVLPGVKEALNEEKN
jgi:predicted nucleotidyltransferase